MVAENNEEVKEEGYGKAVKGVDEKGVHGRTGWSQRNNKRLYNPIHWGFHSHRVPEMFPVSP